MIKEFLIAIFLGGLLGLGLTGSLITLNRRQNNPPPTREVSPTPTTTISPAPSPGLTANQNSSSSTIKISSHQNGQIVNQNKTTLIGTAPSNSTIIVAINSQSTTTQSKADGSFSATIELEAGYNLISISAIEPNDNISEIQINLTYSTASF
ncbi:MAG: hypothetical protein WCV93_03665 [Candidatus Shapirobacteria bacterium]|jgi:hypothetical protein